MTVSASQASARPRRRPVVAAATVGIVATGPGPSEGRTDRRRSVPAFLTSGIVHFVLIVVLACIEFGTRRPEPPWTLTAVSSDEEGVDLGEIESPAVTIAARDDESTEATGVIPVPHLLPDPVVPTVSEPAVFSAGSGVRNATDLLGTPDGRVSAGGLEARTAEGRRKRVIEENGDDRSEHAVMRGLRWLQAHQRPDGGWRFDFRHGTSCGGRCGDQGSASSTTAATSLALLSFLGAGQTPDEGPFRDSVRRGLYYLMNRAEVTPLGADFQEGTMYAQGLSGMALGEASAMTRDAELRILAQGCMNYIVAAQDPHGGGWRYNPGQPGDVSMHGWQWMALKSGEMGYLRIPQETYRKAGMFLDTVESDGGAKYGYLSPGDGTKATQAIGLLCRMYQGWGKNRPGLVSGVRQLAQYGPSRDDMYYNYYATLVLHHWGDDPWREWNRKMTQHLLQTQSTQGHEVGSWHFSGNNGDVGGRLYNTCLAIMTLEVHYRFLPIYRRTSVTPQMD